MENDESMRQLKLAAARRSLKKKRLKKQHSGVDVTDSDDSKTLSVIAATMKPTPAITATLPENVRSMDEPTFPPVGLLDHSDSNDGDAVTDAASRFAAERAGLMRRLSAAEGTVVALDGERAQIQESLNEERRQVSAVQAQLMESQAELKRIRGEAHDSASLVAELNQLKALNAELSEKVTILTSERDASVEAHTQLLGIAAGPELSARCDHLATQNTTLALEVEQLGAEKEVLSEKNRTADKRIYDLECENISCTTENRKLELLLAAQIAKKQTTAELTALQQPTTEGLAEATVVSKTADGSPAEQQLAELKAALVERDAELVKCRDDMATLSEWAVEAEKQLTRRAHAEADLVDSSTSASKDQQIKDLEVQLLELQERFVVISSSNMDLTTELQAAQFREHQVQYRVTHGIDPVNEMDPALVEALASRETVSNALDEISKERDRIAEEHNALAGQIATLTKALQESQQREAGFLEKLDGNSKGFAVAVGASDNDTLVAQLYMQIQQLEMERSALLDKPTVGVKQVKKPSTHGEQQFQQEDLGVKAVLTTEGGAECDSSEYRKEIGLPLLPDGTEPLERDLSAVTIAQLERMLLIKQDNYDEVDARLQHCRSENADLRDRLRMEEEITTQLAQETEAIGEYIDLYHQYRSATTASLNEKDREIERLQVISGALKPNLLRDFETTGTKCAAGDTGVPEFMLLDDSFQIL